jgi:plasmid stabilization system protein ParE
VFHRPGQSQAASKLIGKIKARFAMVLTHPEIGPRRERLAPGLRAHFHRDYVLYHGFADGEVDIVRAMSGR